jgi:hypothetical protein
MINRPTRRPPRKKRGGVTFLTLLLVLAGVAWSVWSGTRDKTDDIFPFDEASYYYGPTERAEEPAEPPADLLTVAELVATRDNVTATPVTLSPGEWIAGEDFEPGRYVVSAAGPDSRPSVEVSAAPFAPGPGESSGHLGWDQELEIDVVMTATLPRGTALYVYGAEFDKVTLTPAGPFEFTGTLGPGDWEAGLDFEPGRYLVEASQDGAVVFDHLGPPREGVEHQVLQWGIFDTFDEDGSNFAELDIAGGDTLCLSGLVTLTKLDG